MKYLWIINNTTGTMLFYRNYSDINVDPDLLSGLLTALNNFSAVELGSSGISSIEMGGLRWVYHQEPNLGIMLIAADDMKSNSEVMRSRLEVISKIFINKYNLTPETFNDLVNVEQFKSFKEDVDVLRQQWELAEKQFGPAQLFDLLGIFQQIFNAMADIVKYNFYGEKFDNIINQINQFAIKLKEDPNIKENPEYEKINYDPERGWDVINLNPMMLEGNNLKRVLFAILTYLKNILSQNMSKMSLLYAFNKYIYPLILSQYEILQNLEILNPLLNVFLKN